MVINFIKESRKRGFSDITIRNALMNNGWPLSEIEKAFSYLTPKYSNRNQVTLFLDEELIEALEKRAKKNMMTVSEQIEDILRRSSINQKGKKSSYNDKLDDALISAFSRKNTGRKKKKK